MRLRANATLRGKDDNGVYAHWPKGCVFDSDVHKIPQDILREFEAGSNLLTNLTPENGGGPAAPSKSKPKSSSPTTNKKQAKVKAKAKTPAKTKTKKSSAKKSKRKAF